MIKHIATVGILASVMGCYAATDQPAAVDLAGQSFHSSLVHIGVRHPFPMSRTTSAGGYKNYVRWFSHPDDPPLPENPEYVYLFPFGTDDALRKGQAIKNGTFKPAPHCTPKPTCQAVPTHVFKRQESGTYKMTYPIESDPPFLTTHEYTFAQQVVDTTNMITLTSVPTEEEMKRATEMKAGVISGPKTGR